MGQAKPPLEVLAFLVDLRRYQDRMLMLRHASEQLGRLHLVTPVLPPGFDPEPLRTPSFEIVPLAKRLLPRPVLQPLLHVLVLQRLALFPGIRILHDTMGFFIPLFAQERLLGRMGCPRPALLTSSFAALYDWHGVVRHRWPYRWHRFLRARWQGLALERAIFALADAVTLFGEGHREPLARAYGIPPERVFSLPNCVDEALFRPVAPEAALTTFPPGDTVLLFLGALFRHKGIFELVRAFARIAGHHPRARLLLVGQAHPREERLLKAEIAALGLDRLVHQVGELPRAQLPACLSACGGFVFPSYNEGSPRSVIEAMACGLPIVASRIPGIEALDPKADFIQFVERGEVEGLAAALDLLLAHPDQTRLRGECGRRHFLEHHTPRAASQPLVDLYRLLDERSVCQPIRSMTSR